MANVIITEFVGTLRGGQTQAAYGPLASQVIAIGGSSAASVALHKDAGLVLVYAEADCNICIAADPNAGTGIIIPFGAGDRDYISVEPGSQMKVACISRTVA